MGKLSWFIALGIVAFIAAMPPNTACASIMQWSASQGGNDHWYGYVGGTETWTQAKLDAAQLSYDGLPGHLATITSPAESNFIYQHFSPVQAWLGGYQDRTAPDYSEPAGGWRWVTGETWSYTNWATQYGFPDNYGGYQDYLKYASGPNWDDLENNPGPGPTGVDGFLVEFEPVPEPATVGLFALGGVVLLCNRRSARRAIRLHP